MSCVRCLGSLRKRLMMWSLCKDCSCVRTACKFDVLGHECGRVDDLSLSGVTPLTLWVGYSSSVRRRMLSKCYPQTGSSFVDLRHFDTEPRRIWNCSRLILVGKPGSYRWALDLRIDVVHYCALLEHRRFLLDTMIFSNWK